jgi:hypothetical protein
MSTYTRAPLGFKAHLAHRRDELVLRELEERFAECTPVLAINMLASARGWLHSREYTTGSLDAIVLLFHAETTLKIEMEGL